MTNVGYIINVKKKHLHTKKNPEMSTEGAHFEHLPLLFVVPQNGIMSGSMVRR
jgi:hypothetical protein